LGNVRLEGTPLAGGEVLGTARVEGEIPGSGIQGNGVPGFLGSNPHANVSSTSVNHVAGIKKPPPWVKTPRRRGKRTVTAAVAREGNGHETGTGTAAVGENGH